MSAQQPSFEQRGGNADLGQQVLTQLDSLTDYLMTVAKLLQSAVRFPAIGLNNRPRFNDLSESGQQMRRRCVGNGHHPYPPDLLPIGLGCRHH